MKQRRIECQLNIYVGLVTQQMVEQGFLKRLEIQDLKHLLNSLVHTLVLKIELKTITDGQKTMGVLEAQTMMKDMQTLKDCLIKKR